MQGYDEIGSFCNNLIKKYGKTPNSHKILEALRQVQEEYNYIPRKAIEVLSEGFEIASAKLYGPAAFYEEFSLMEQGKFHLKICDGSSCYVKKSLETYDAVREELGISGEEYKTNDNRFTVEVVSCMGRCGEAPVMKLNGEILTGMDRDKTLDLIRELKRI